MEANNIGSGAIEMIDPKLGLVSRVKRGKKLRDIIGKEIKKEENHDSRRDSR